MSKSPNPTLPPGFAASLRRNQRLWLILCCFSLVAVVVFAYFLYRSHRDRLRTERSLLRLSQELQSDRLSQHELERRVAEAREELGRYRSETEAAFARLKEQRENLQKELRESARSLEQRSQRIAEVEGRLAAATRKIRELERERRVGERVIQNVMAGVAFLEVTYTFEDQKGRRIRFESVDASGNPVTDTAGEASVSVEADGPIVHIRSSGTGFLIGGNRLLTNRHVVEPWKENKAAQPFLKNGFRPVRTVFRGFFPGAKEGFIMRPVRVSTAADLALLEFDSKGTALPVLELERDPAALRIGGAVLLIGYPAGVESLLARVDAATLKKIRELRGNKVMTITPDLSERGLIRPLVTWGHLAEIQPHQLTYDALTTAGGSGSPILNSRGKVIGVNQAMLKSFAGSSFGIPAGIVAEFLAMRE